MNEIRNTSGKIFFVLTIAATVSVVFFVATATGIGPAAAAGNAMVLLFGLAVVGCLALVSLVVGWHVKFIRHSFFGLAGILALGICFNMLGGVIQGYKFAGLQERREHNKQLVDRIIEDHSPQLVTSRADPEKTLSLIKAMEAKLREGKIDPDCRVADQCEHPHKYVKFKGSTLLHLGIFVDPKYLKTVSDDLKYAYFYADFYDKNRDAFTKELHFSRLFEVMRLKTYSDHEKIAIGFHESDQTEFAETLAQKEYLEAFLLFIPLTAADFFTNRKEPVDVLKGARELDSALGVNKAVAASIAHTSYHYFASGYACELDKFDRTFHVLRDSTNLDQHIGALFTQMPEQCRYREWRSPHKIDEQAYCYLQKDPNWVRMYTSDGKLRENLYEHIDCGAVR